MASSPPTENVLVSLYRSNIGDPSESDEAYGYWVFVAGLLLGIVGIGLFVAVGTDPNLRLWSFTLLATGLLFMIAGPVIRLPLRNTATWLVYLGVALGGIAIIWFVSAILGGSWDAWTGSSMIIGLYAIGLFSMGVAAVIVPILSDRAELEATATALETELAELEEMLEDTGADEADLAAIIADLRAALDDAKADEADLARVIEDIRAKLTDTAADEADLAARLQSLEASQSQFEIYQDSADEWRWRLRHRNRNIVATSGEGYTAQHNAQKGMEAVRRDALGAGVVVFEEEAVLPAADDPVVLPDVIEDSSATFERYEDTAGDWRWRLRHDNGNIIADGGQGYASPRGVTTAIERIRDLVGPAQYLSADPTAFAIFRDAAGEWRWHLVHRNGNILADGGEGYASRSNARRAVDRLREGIDTLSIEIYEDESGEFRYRIEAGNGQIVADSGEGYGSEDGAEKAVERIREYAPEANVLDIGAAAFEVFEDRAGEVRWRLRHRNGRILADSGEGYSRQTNAWKGIESVKRNAPAAELIDVDVADEE